MTVRDSSSSRKTGRRASPPDEWDLMCEALRERLDRSTHGIVVIDADKQRWQQSRQGREKYFLNRENDTGTVLRDWVVFVNDIKKHGGKHQHQGGLVIFVLEGEGYTVIDGERIDWSAGDLLLLPIKPEGVEHQHFNLHADESCQWIAFIFRPYQDQIAYYMDQKEVAPEFRM